MLVRLFSVIIWKISPCQDSAIKKDDNLQFNFQTFGIKTVGQEKGQRIFVLVAFILENFDTLYNSKIFSFLFC